MNHVELKSPVQQLEVIFGNLRHVQVLAAIASFNVDSSESFASQTIHEMTATLENSSVSFPWKRIQELEEAKMVHRLADGRRSKGKRVLYERTDAKAWQIVDETVDVFGISFLERPEARTETDYSNGADPTESTKKLIFGYERHFQVLAAIAGFSLEPQEPLYNKQVHEMTIDSGSPSEGFPCDRIKALERAGMVKKLPGRDGKKIRYVRLDVPSWRVVDKAIEVFGMQPPPREAQRK